MEALLAGLEGTAVAQTLRTSRWLYVATNTAAAGRIPRRDDGVERARSLLRWRLRADLAHHFATLTSVHANLGRPTAPIP